MGMNKKDIAVFLERQKPLLQQKSHSAVTCGSSFANYLYTGGNYDLQAYQAMKYFVNCAPVYTAVDWIANEGSRIEPLVYDNKNKQFSDNQDIGILNLLRAPNALSTYEEFAYKFITYYLTAGNVFMLATGDVSKPPKEVFLLSPHCISFIMDSDGFPKTIFYRNEFISIDFHREEAGNRIRYYNKDKNLELWQSKTFNPLRSYADYWGLSPLSPVFYDIEQYINTGIHNLAILKQGGKPSGAIVYEENLSEEQRARLQEQIDTFYAGAENAGRIGMFEGSFEYKEFGKNAKDMDFYNLKLDAAHRVYNALRIPLPLVSADTMTMSNVGNAKVSLYDNAILPMVDKMFSQLSLFLLSRYTNDSNISLSYDVGSILALAPRRNDELEKYSKMDIFTINELRALVGYEKVVGGDDIYQPSMNVPVAADTDPNNPELSTDLKMDVRQRFISIMRLQVNESGDRRYTDNEILGIADRNGL